MSERTLSTRRLWFAFLLMAIAMPVAASAQALTQKNEISAGVGRSLIENQSIKPGTIPLTDDTVHFSTAASFEFGYARRLMSGDLFELDAEVPFSGTPKEKLHSGNGLVPSKYSAYFITPAARLKFFTKHVFQPWVSGGGGYGHFHFDTLLVSGEPNPGPLNRNAGIIEGGVGIDTKSFSHIAFRVAGRDFWSPALPLNVDTGRSRQHNLIFTGGLVVRF